MKNNLLHLLFVFILFSACNSIDLSVSTTITLLKPVDTINNKYIVDSSTAKWKTSIFKCRLLPW